MLGAASAASSSTAAAVCGGRLGRLWRRRPWRAHSLPHAWSRAFASAANLSIDDAHVVRSHEPIDFYKETVPDIVWANLARHQDKVAVECGVTGRRLTYAQVRDAARRLAVALRSPRMLGPRRPEDQGKRGADTALLTANIPEFAPVLMGAAEAGATLSTINPQYTPDEVGRQLVDSGARVVFSDAPSILLAQAALAQRPANQRPILVRIGPGDVPSGVLRFEDITGPDAPLESTNIPDIGLEEVAVLPYSSGTTGMPKGVMLTHRNLTCNLRQMQHPTVAHQKPTEGDFQDIVPAVIPFFHIYGLVVLLLNSMCLGSRVISLPKFDPLIYVRTMIEKKATALFAAPPLLLFLANHPMVPPEALASVRFSLCGAAPLAAADAERLLSKAPKRFPVVQGYGMTESSPVLTQGRKEFMSAVGPPVPATEAVVVDLETGASVPHGQVGELCFRGPQVMPGYWQRPEETASTLSPDGWLCTGDVGRLDENGDFLILDRVKELIKVKGFQVAPAELEALLRLHKEVAEAAVVGVADERSGELPCAYVVAHEPPADAAGAAALRAALADHVAARASRHKHLKGGVRIVASIPKNASGKILRRQLRIDPPPQLFP